MDDIGSNPSAIGADPLRNPEHIENGGSHD
jgi:hypothetical protein